MKKYKSCVGNVCRHCGTVCEGSWPTDGCCSKCYWSPAGEEDRAHSKMLVQRWTNHNFDPQTKLGEFKEASA
jgi:hypothetical protein